MSACRPRALAIFRRGHAYSDPIPIPMTVTTADVRELLPSERAESIADTAISGQIHAARRLYRQRVQGDLPPSGASEGVVADVVTRLAAHLVMTGPLRQADSVSEGGANVSFSGETGQGLYATLHGQMAITMDPTGELDPQDDAPDSGDEIIFNG